MTSPVPAGAEAFTLQGDSRGVLLLHGLSANPYALHPFAESLSRRGYTVRVPLLPGHGTRWEDLEPIGRGEWIAETARSLLELREGCSELAVVGLSLGAALAACVAGGKDGTHVRALVFVNPYLLDRRLAFAPAVRFVRRSVAGVGDDIRAAGRTERPYPRIPVRTLVEVSRLQAAARRALPQIRQPLLLLRSAVDNVVPRGNAEMVLRRIGSAEKRVVTLADSYHVAWIDNDAEILFDETAGFLSRHLRD